MTTGREQSPSGTWGSEITDRVLNIWSFFLILNSLGLYRKTVIFCSCRCFSPSWGVLLGQGCYCCQSIAETWWNTCSVVIACWWSLPQHWNGYWPVGIWRADAQKQGWTLALNSRVTTASVVNRAKITIIGLPGHTAVLLIKVLWKRTEEIHQQTITFMKTLSRADAVMCVAVLTEACLSPISTQNERKKYEIIFCIK